MSHGFCSRTGSWKKATRTKKVSACQIKLLTISLSVVEGEGDLTKRLDVKSGDELEELAEGVNKIISNQQTAVATGEIGEKLRGYKN